MTDFPAADLSRVHSAAHVQFTQDRLMKMLVPLARAGADLRSRMM